MDSDVPPPGEPDRAQWYPLRDVCHWFSSPGGGNAGSIIGGIAVLFTFIILVVKGVSAR
jgi:hypothetical protein